MQDRRYIARPRLGKRVKEGGSREKGEGGGEGERRENRRKRKRRKEK